MNFKCFDCRKELQMSSRIDADIVTKVMSFRYIMEIHSKQTEIYLTTEIHYLSMFRR